MTISSCRTDARPAAARSRRAAGLTLIEVCLVLAVLVVVAAVAYPHVQGPFARQRVRKAAELVRVELARARNTAMRTGRIMMFRYELNQGRFVTLPFARQQDFVEGDLATTGGNGGTGPRAGLPASQSIATTTTRPGMLPAGIVFAQVAVGSDTRMSYELPSTGPGAWGISGTSTAAPPIVLYPDGTSSDARIVLRDRDGRASLVTLRGLTGMTRASDWNPQQGGAMGVAGGGPP